jgi:hypothetical protein
MFKKPLIKGAFCCTKLLSISKKKSFKNRKTPIG